MGRVARKKQHKGDKPLKEKYRTKRKTKDIDEIHEDMIPAKSQKLLNQEVDYDKPGAAQFYCVHCAKYFINEPALKEHFRGKPHKRRIKALQVEPYTQAEADRAAGMGSYVAPKPIHVVTETRKTKMEEDT
ncbi:zinc finger protein 593-like [Mya arenaria]|uniref:zinc finger protein 593-like n=1 Tax=Mya arenaria TaxID=6604 RepID=UPI0022E1F69F|nr:zinc finger protein 593-like [Mya arenaria]XP_052810494.1 zinc finger protein 593-like [Mya arenaria]